MCIKITTAPVLSPAKCFETWQSFKSGTEGDSNFSSLKQIVENFKLETPTSDGQLAEDA